MQQQLMETEAMNLKDNKERGIWEGLKGGEERGNDVIIFFFSLHTSPSSPTLPFSHLNFLPSHSPFSPQKD